MNSKRQSIPNERGVLLGLIQAIVMSASTRMVTDGDRTLTTEELHNNAQETLDSIARECDLVLGNYEIKELLSMSRQWAAWKSAQAALDPKPQLPR